MLLDDIMMAQIPKRHVLLITTDFCELAWNFAD